MLQTAAFDSANYGPDIARVLALCGNGLRPMPLVKSEDVSRDVCAAVQGLKVSAGVRAGLYLYLGSWEDAHTVADGIESPTGSFWHGIVHRQEPDSANAAYWFRKTGRHPIFPRLATAAGLAGYRGGREWDPFRFIDFCGGALPESADENLAKQIQLTEWQLLFDHSAWGEDF
jgi:hypothetical protein